MSKESEISDSSTHKTDIPIVKELKASLFSTHGYIAFDYFTLLWLFVGGSILGLALETVYHAIVFGGFESRPGLVWGPFSPIYGTGALALTVFLNRYYHSHNLVIFLVAMVVGSFIEYCASWGMEVFWGAIAWDYTGTFGSIQGRTNFFFGMMWGMLGLFWVRIVLPIIKRVFKAINSDNPVLKILTVIMTFFLILDVIATFAALSRAKERADHVPASNPIQELCDEWFSDDFVKTRFQNMTVTGSKYSISAYLDE